MHLAGDVSSEKSTKGAMDIKLWWYIVGAAGLFILISLSIIICACVTRSRRHHKEKKKMQKFTEPM